MDLFWKSLGDTVLSHWKRENFSLQSFPDIATKALTKHPPAKHIDLSTLITDFLLAEDHPAQTDSDFGQPEIVAYSHARFYIQLLFWMDGTTAIHQHEFSGAFHVMHGSSIHAHYTFEKPHSITPYLRIGNLKMKEMELLETGRTVPISSGHHTIHSLFHLDSPSVTVVVRTQHDPGTGPQFNFMPPHVAFDPHFSDKLTARRKQLLDVVMHAATDSDAPAYATLVKKMIADLDFERGFSILHHAQGYLQHLGEWDATLKLFEKKHGPTAKGIRATLNEEVRRTVLKDFRTTITTPEHRFFLALLMNAPSRSDLLSLVSQRYPRQRPTEIILRWITELTEVTPEGTTILDATFPEALGVDPESQPDLFHAALKHFLSTSKKVPHALRSLPPKAIKELRAAFADSALSLLTT